MELSIHSAVASDVGSTVDQIKGVAKTILEIENKQKELRELSAHLAREQLQVLKTYQATQRASSDLQELISTRISELDDWIKRLHKS